MRIATISFLLLLSFGLYSQTETDSLVSAEDLFRKARTLSENDEVSAAKALSLFILEEYPEYNDLKIYLALLYGRGSYFDSAFIQLRPVLDAEPENADALLARSTLFFWSEQWDSLLVASSEALEALPGNTDLLYQQALAQYMSGQKDDALETLDQLLLSDPENERTIKLRKQLLTDHQGPEIFIRYMFDHFKQPYLRKWHMLSTGVSYPLAKGTISPYLNTGHFVDETRGFLSTTAFQLNTDAYLNITEKNVLLLGYGVGTGDYFPRHRALLHIWQVFPAAWSVSAGARYFYFDQHYIFYVFGADKYIGNYWFDLKNYVFRKDYGLSMASYLTVRRYGASRYDYISGTIGYGTSPDEPITSLTDLQRLNSLSAQLMFMKQLSGQIKIGAGAGYQYEEFLDLQYRHRINLQAAIYYKFY